MCIFVDGKIGLGTPFTNNNTMETSRILLRPWLESDDESLFRYASDPEVGPLAGWAPHKSREESREIIRTYFLNDHTWAIELKKSGEVVGCIGYLRHNESNISIGEKEVEVGYWVAKPFWNQGICSETLGLVVAHCLHEKGFDALWGDYFIDNPASGRVMEKCGFIHTGATRFCPHLYGGEERPVEVMRL